MKSHAITMKETLRKELIQGAYPPGTFLRQQELAETFQVSRTPAREVLSALESEGYLENIPHAGYRVVEVSLADLLEILEMRSLLEGHAARLLAGSVYTELLFELEGISEKLKEWKKHYLQEGGEAAFRRGAELDCRFHQRIVDSCGNTLLAVLYRRVEIDRFHWKRRHFNFYRTNEAPTHNDIISAIRSGNPDKAERTARAHLNYRKEHLLRSFPDPKKSNFKERTL